MSWVDEFVDFTKCEVELTEKSLRILETITKKTRLSKREFINFAIARMAQNPDLYKKEPEGKPEDYIFGIQEPIIVNRIPMSSTKDIDPDDFDGLEDELIEDIDFNKLKGGKQRSEAIYMKARWLGISKSDVADEVGISKQELETLYCKYESGISQEMKDKIAVFLKRDK